MKMTTMVWLGIRHVGNAGEQPTVDHLTAQDACVRIITSVKASSLAKRIQFSIAATEAECRKGIADAPRTLGGVKHDEAFDMLMDMISSGDTNDAEYTKTMIAECTCGESKMLCPIHELKP